jgi:adenylate cyclase
VARIEVGGYRPRLRGGLHVGQAHRLGADYLGVDVNVAYRICEDAAEGEALVSSKALERLDATALDLRGSRVVRRPGVPEDLEVHVAALDGAPPTR